MKHAATDASPAFAFHTTTAFVAALPVAAGAMLRMLTNSAGDDEAVIVTPLEVKARPATAAAIRNARDRLLARQAEKRMNRFTRGSLG